MKIKYRFKYIAILFGTLFIFSSCASVTNIPIEIIKPADYSFAPNILSVLIVDNAPVFSDDSVHTTNLFGKKGVMEARSVEKFGLYAAEGLGEKLDEKRFFDSVFVHPISLNRPVDGVHEPDLTLEMIDSLLNYYNAQAILSLEDYRFHTDINALDVGDSFYLTLDAFGTAYWKVYDKDGYILDTYVQNDSIFWDSFVVKNNSNELAVPDLEDALETLGSYMGGEYTKRVSPVWERNSRAIFTRGHHLFARANDLVQVQHWNEAAKVWYYVFQNGSKLQKAISAHNIALSYEMRNDFDEAIEWAKISKKQFGELKSWQINNSIVKMSEEYIDILLERQKDSIKLNEQLGPL